MRMESVEPEESYLATSKFDRDSSIPRDFPLKRRYTINIESREKLQWTYGRLSTGRS
jgi:hypothetical protein